MPIDIYQRANHRQKIDISTWSAQVCHTESCESNLVSWETQEKKAAIAKKKKPVPKIIYQAWPVINPAQLFRRLVQADRRLLCSDDFSWQAFWEKARTEDWALNHPVLNLPSKEQGMAMACSFHGDEGQTKRQKNCMVLSWSSIAVSGKSELTKFPYCVSWLHDVPRVSQFVFKQLMHPIHFHGHGYFVPAESFCFPLRFSKANCLRL